ncbi:unnamed protein product [Adineta ricciae]|uniref:U-box domain-containing protein n=1 Tax=Adineta ricciae TaxID=249248 RepID=A0A814LC45_ADIRI|nr:unnamed protein product [Adineta ricciae]CAF1302426.1 unnamed protein product [Adineta ricciae]
MESCKCPTTGQMFEDLVARDNGHTYERAAIVDWLSRNETSPMTREPMGIDSLKPNCTVKKMIDEWKAVSESQQIQHQFQLDIDGAKANRETSFYVQLGYQPRTIRTFDLAQRHPGSVMPTERVLIRVFEQICDAMIYLSDNGIIHGDLAYRNAFVFRSNPMTIVPVRYVAPETLQNSDRSKLFREV